MKITSKQMGLLTLPIFGILYSLFTIFTATEIYFPESKHTGKGIDPNAFVFHQVPVGPFHSANILAWIAIIVFLGMTVYVLKAERFKSEQGGNF